MMFTYFGLIDKWSYGLMHMYQLFKVFYHQAFCFSTDIILFITVIVKSILF